MYRSQPLKTIVQFATTMVDLQPAQNGGMADFKANAIAIAIAFQAATVSGVDAKSRRHS
jgi:hypothetical protein